MYMLGVASTIIFASQILLQVIRSMKLQNISIFEQTVTKVQSRIAILDSLVILGLI